MALADGLIALVVDLGQYALAHADNLDNLTSVRSKAKKDVSAISRLAKNASPTALMCRVNRDRRIYLTGANFDRELS